MTKFKSILLQTEDDSIKQKADDMENVSKLTIQMFITNTKIELFDRQSAVDAAEKSFFRGDKDAFSLVREGREDIADMTKAIKDAEEYLAEISADVK